MELMLNIEMKSPVKPITYRDKILLMGSCFTEHIGDALEELKFLTLQNPNGILFDPHSVCRSLATYVQNKKYTEADLFQLNEVWHSWNHHSRFSNINAKEAVRIINDSQQEAHEFLKEADWIIITLGSSFCYHLSSGGEGSSPVANCHRAPAQWFNKHLLEISETISLLDVCIQMLLEFNPRLNFIFTVSPVRHIRDGIIENNRSKARLLESVHHIVDKYEQAHYFPAYELMIDVLRDYRFYDIDLVHPNYPATEFVLKKFAESCIDSASQQLLQEVKDITIARNHKAFQPETKAHQQFLVTYFEKTKTLQKKYPFLDLKEELVYFSQT